MKKSGKIKFLIFLPILFFLSNPACETGDPDPRDYFPTKTGLRWVYNLTRATDYKPIQRIKSYWQENDGIASSTRREYVQFYQTEDGKRQLILKVKGPVPGKGPFGFKNAIEIEVERDDVDIYPYCMGLYWIVEPENSYKIIELALFKPDTLMSASIRGHGDGTLPPGISQQVKFYSGKPGFSMKYESDKEELLYVGPEKLNGQMCVHYRLTTLRDSWLCEGYDNYLCSSFTEDMWFVKGKGMIKLVQNVNGHTTMTWELVSFAQAK